MQSMQYMRVVECLFMSLAGMATALARARRLPEIENVVCGSVVPRLSADEFIFDIASHDLSRAPLIRIGVQDVWAKRYNSEFHRLNPVTAALKAHLDQSGIVVRRFCRLVARAFS